MSTALSYLESKKFVHRDIAARNVLVSSPSCIKVNNNNMTSLFSNNFLEISSFLSSWLILVYLVGCQSNPIIIPACVCCQLNGWHQNQLIFVDLLLPAMFGCLVKLLHSINTLPTKLINYLISIVYTFGMKGVCAWEILMLGVKPFQGVKNSDVIVKLENGERLPFPHNCPPRLYSLLSQCWAYEPLKRPNFQRIKETL